MTANNFLHITSLAKLHFKKEKDGRRTEKEYVCYKCFYERRNRMI